MATSPAQFARELKAFDDRRVILKQLRKDIRQPVPKLRQSIKANALSTLPKRGGLNKWVANTRVTAQIRVTSRTVTVKVKGGRNSQSGRSDVNAIDRGRVRAPSWPAQSNRRRWHSQTVAPGFWTKAVDKERAGWLNVIEQAVDDATATIRGG